jgi:Arf-GAP/SH3 domain/ANK repeat/PH domain-containing protein
MPLTTLLGWILIRSTDASTTMSHPNSPSPFQLAVPPKIRVASAHSVDSRISEVDEPGSPLNLQSDVTLVAPVTSHVSQQAVKVDVACPRPGDDMTVSDDGPVFRATMKALERKTGDMRTHMKKVLKKAEHAHTTQVEANEAFLGFTESLREASATNANAVQPALEHYFDKIAREILSYERQNAANIQRIVIDPISKLYTYDIKQAESKKRDFEEESKDYYAYVSRYLGQRQDSVKTKKLADSDTKYQTKRRNFELKRFDYSSFMQDLHGGRKEQEVLSHLTKYADSQARSFLTTAKKIDDLLPQLQALSSEVQEADKEYQFRRHEREEKRRALEKTNLQYNEPETTTSTASIGTITTPPLMNGNQISLDSDLGRPDSTGSQLKAIPTSSSGAATTSGVELSRSPGSLGHATLSSPSQNAKFRGIRDLEERDPALTLSLERSEAQRKEGLLWALNRPGGHVDPRSLTKQQGWHK